MSLQDELTQIRAVLQAVCDYVGNQQVAAQLQANQERLQKEATEALKVQTETAQEASEAVSTPTETAKEEPK